jgi:hypothetical protein
MYCTPAKSCGVTPENPVTRATMRTITLLAGPHCRRPPRPSLLAKLAVGSIVAGSSLVRDHRRHLDRRRRIATTGGGSFGIAMATRDGDANANLWSTALDGMIDVPGAGAISSSEGVLYLSPVATETPSPFPAENDVPTSSSPWPAIFADGGMAFSLTAHNPMGKSVPREDNIVANSHLERDIVDLVNSDVESADVVRPRAWWHSFGFHEMEGWREDGYTVSFGPEDDDGRDRARDAILELAGKYRQAAIYEYYYERGTLMREVVYVDPVERKARGEIKDVMTIVDVAPSRSALSGRCRDG